MDLESALRCLDDNKIRFVQPSLWHDEFESRFFEADYSHVTTNPNLHPQLWACCFTLNKMSEAAWNTYTYNKQGLASRCVKFTIKRNKFRQMLRNSTFVKKTYEGKIDYTLSDYDIINLHKKTSPLYNSFFGSFDIDKYLTLLLIKRNLFSYENEFRFLISLNCSSDKELYIPVNWSKLIQAVEVDQNCTDKEVEILQRWIMKVGIGNAITSSVQKADIYGKTDLKNEKIIIE